MKTEAKAMLFAAAALAAGALFADTQVVDGYTVYIDIIAKELKCDCSLILKVMLDDNGSVENYIRLVQ